MSPPTASARRIHEIDIRPARRTGPDPVALVPATGPAGGQPRSTSPDVLELLLLHGDCAFLLDLREL